MSHDARPPDCQLVVSVGDALASDLEVAEWIASGSEGEVVRSVPYDGGVLSAADFAVLEEHRALGALEVLGESLVAANVVLADGEPAVGSYVLVGCDERRVALVGVTSETSGQFLETSKPVDAIAGIIGPLRKETDIIVLLSNAGPDAERAIAAQIEGLDVVIAGGAEPLDCETPEGQSDPLVCRPGFPGRSVGIAELSFDSNGRLVRYRWDVQMFVPSP